MCTHWWLQSALSSIPRLTNTRVAPNEKQLWPVNRDASDFVRLLHWHIHLKNINPRIYPISVSGETAVFGWDKPAQWAGYSLLWRGDWFPLPKSDRRLRGVQVFIPSFSRASTNSLLEVATANKKETVGSLCQLRFITRPKWIGLWRSCGPSL
jgi:hypothetical protein